MVWDATLKTKFPPLGFLLGACLLTFAGVGQAQELTGTLKKIKDSGAIAVGARESAAPFSYNLEASQYVGYSVDIMMKVVDRIKAGLKLPNLQVKVMPFTAQNRIPLIHNGTLDFECSTTTRTRSNVRNRSPSRTPFS